MGGILDQLLGLGNLKSIALATLLVTIVGISFVYFTRIRYPANLPRYGEKEGATSFRLKTRMAYYTDCKNMFKDIYEKFGKHGRTVLIPGMGFRNEIIIANTSLPWLTAQPDSVLSIWAGFVELDQVQHTLWNSHFVADPWQGMIVKRDMNAVLENIVLGLDDELKFAFDARFGEDTKEWKDITLFGTAQKIVGQASGRFTVGLPLCRDEAYIDQNIDFPDIFFAVAGIATGLPRILRPILGPFIGIPLRYKLYQIKNSFRTLFHQRMQLLQSPKSEDPQDHLQMMLRYAQTDRPNELNLDSMTLRLAMSNFGSVHQTSVAVTNIIFNVLESDKKYNTIAVLRKEAAEVLGGCGGSWTKATAAKMVRADSVCRETLRINAFGNRSLIRKVMVDDLTTEDGILLPKGALVSVLAHPAQCDEEAFTDPTKFDPWRFSRIREQCPEGGDKSSLVSLGPQNLPFGLGRHACPGRFLLDFELKMILAYLFTNYDVELHPEHEGKRPQSMWFAEAIFPPKEGKIRVRRREVKS